MRKLMYLAAASSVAASVAAIAFGGVVNPLSRPSSSDVRAEGHVFAPGHPVLQDNLRITLTEARFSLTRSRLSVEIRNGDYAGDKDMAPAFLDPQMVHISGVSETRPVRITNVARPDAQTITYLVEGGAPVPGDWPVGLTIDEVLLWSGQSAEAGIGPWTFEVRPNDATYEPGGAVQNLGLVAEQDGVRVVLDQLWTTPEETLVVYTISSPPGFVGSAGAPVRIILEDGSIIPGLPLDPDQAGSGKRVVALPPLPAGATQLQVEFGPYLLRTIGAVFDVGLESLSAAPMSEVGEYVLDETVATSAGDVRIAGLTVEDESFVIDLAPVEAAPNAGFAGSLPDASVLARDDRGNTYRAVSASVSFGKDSLGTPSFSAQRYTFAGTLDAGARSLSIDVSSLAQLADGPWSFSVSIAE